MKSMLAIPYSDLNLLEQREKRLNLTFYLLIAGLRGRSALDCLQVLKAAIACNGNQLCSEGVLSNIRLGRVWE